MERTYRYILNNMNEGSIPKEAAVELIKLIKSETQKKKEDIAIVGIGVDLPNAENTDELWSNLCYGLDLVSEFPKERKKDTQEYFNYVSSDGNHSDLDYLEGGFLDEIDKFDYNYFKLTPKEASLMDPCQRIFLQTTIKAIEDSGHDINSFKGSNTGVFVGFANTSNDSYQKMIFDVERDSISTSIASNLSAIIPSRISYFLDFDGPSMVVDTACSSSLVAVHLASNAIRNGECSQAIVGGIKLHMLPFDVEYSKMGIESSDGLTRTFDDNSDGAGIGEGSIAIILKPISKAIEDKDRIYAVIKGSAVNQDGSSAGITAPNPAAQAKVITKAWKEAGINPEDLCYIEAHGTATKLGDPIEIEGLKKAFEGYTDKKQFCAIGSLKSNIGHLYECSGLANLVKVALSIKNKKLVKSINFQTPNVRCDFINSPLYVNTELQDLSKKADPIICGVSSFGFSGTNCHVVLKQAEDMEAGGVQEENEDYLFTVSATSQDSMKQLYRNYIEFLLEEQELNLRSFCYTSNISRGSHPFRTAILFQTEEELLKKLTLLIDNHDYTDKNVFSGYFKVVSESYMDIKDHKISQEYRNQLSSDAISVFDNCEKVDIEKLRTICELYTMGAEVPFERIYEREAVTRVKLPTYMFEKQRLWLHIPSFSEQDDQMYYSLDWIEDIKNKEDTHNDGLLNQQLILVMNEENEMAYKVLNELKNSEIECIKVVIGEKFMVQKDDTYIITDSQRDFELFLSMLELEDSFHIIYMVEALQECSHKSRLRNLRNIVKAIETFGQVQCQLDLVLKNTTKVLQEDIIYSENALLFGYGLGIQKEFDTISCKSIDIDEISSAKRMIAVISEVSRKDQVALRSNKKYIKCLREMDVNQGVEENILRDDGVYVFTGGLGGISLALAEDISRKNKVNLILCSRRDFPEPTHWEQLLQNGTDKKQIDQLQIIQKILNNGSHVEVVRCNLGNENNVKEMLAYVQHHYGTIHGIIHSAGVEENELILKETDEGLEEVLAPKVMGTYYIDQYTMDLQMDFFVLFSSIATVFPAPAQAGYIAANSFLESFAMWRNLQGRPTKVIRWSTWGETGMAYRNGANVDTAFKVLTTVNGIQGFYKVLNHNIDHVLVGYMNTNPIFTKVWENALFNVTDDIAAKFSKVSINREIRNRKKIIQTAVSDVTLLGRTDAYYTETEKRLAGLIGGLLGFEQIYVYDSLYELGVDSILMVKISKKIDDEFAVEFPISTFLDHATIEKIAMLIDSSKKKVISEKKTVVIKANQSEPFKLTDVQYSYLLGRDIQYEIGNVSTHAYVEVETEYDISKLNDALNKTIQQHPMLRAVVLPEGRQKILPEVEEYTIKCADFIDNPEYKEYLLQERERMSHDIFDVHNWPLFEFNAIKYSEKKTLLLISFDMLIADAVSIQIVLRDIMEFYSDENRQIKSFEYSFQDYMQEYELIKETETYKKDKDFWLEKLADFPTAPSLPLACDPLLVDKPYFVRKNKLVQKETWNKIKKKAVQLGVTPSALVCTAYSEVLSYWSNQPRLALNLAVFNRYPFHKDVDEMVGDFTTVVLLDVELQSNADLITKAINVQKSLMQALEHRSYEGIEFLRELAKEQNLKARAIMPIVFTSMIYNAQEDSFHLLGEKTYGISQTSQVYLDCQVSDAGGELSVVWDYVEQLFQPEMIDTMFDHFTGLIESYGSDCLYQMELSEEDRLCIEEYNDTEEALKVTTLSRMFRCQADKTPDKIAIIDGDRSITYAELDARSNQVSNYLRSKGIGAHDFVGIEAKRGIDSLIHVFGILKAGAAYVPIDPTYGQERKDYIIENAGCREVLTTDWYEREGLNYSTESGEEVSSPEAEAYVIYTSGSTGKPKGVIISNQAVCNTIQDINKKLHITEEDRMIGISSMCFDLSVYDIFGALTAGASLVIVEDPRDVSDLLKRVEENKVTIWNSVPAIVTMAADAMGEEYHNSSVRQIMMSGDWIPMNLPSKIKEKFLNAEMMSLGGATEASIWSIYYPFQEVKKEWGSIPYGRPLANQSFYVLNYAQELCPLGVMGELYIGGIGVANGYQNNEEQTRAAFLDHEAFGRIYRTGDYGVMRRDDQSTYIEFMGRKDNQVKIQGFRVELGEIEKCMTALPGISEAVVVDYKDQKGHKYLCAYYVSEEEQDRKQIKESMAKELPDYMLPQQIMRIEQIPLTGNGKVDRTQLTKPQKVSNRKRYIATRNELEGKLVAIFEEELKTAPIGIEDDFFTLGINSILMVSIINRIGKELHANIKFKELADKNTIMELAELIVETLTVEDSKELYITTESDKENEHMPFPMTEIQNSYMIGRKDIFDLGNISTHGYMEFATFMDIGRMNQALNKVIKRQGMLRCVFDEDGTQHICEGDLHYTIDVEDISGREDQQLRIAEIRDKMSHYVFDPGIWPLFEVRAVKLDEKTNYIFVGYDLLIADGASMQIVNKELLEYYRDPELQLPELGFTFRDYMMAYSKFKLESEVYKRDKDYWLSQLEDFPLAPALPLNMDMSQIKEVRFNRKHKVFSQEEWTGIREKAKKLGVTPSTLVCAAYCEVLGFWSNQSRFALNMTIFNRYPFHKDVEKIVGEFTSIILVDVDLSKGDSFDERSRSLQALLFEVLEYRHYEGVEFIRELSKHHNLGTSAIMPIVFTSMIFDDKFNMELREDEVRNQLTGISQTSQVYLDCQVSDAGGELVINIDYVEQLFKSAVIDQFFEQFVGILEHIVHSDQEYELRISDEERGLIDCYNSTNQDIDSRTLHGLFNKQVELVPENIALIMEKDSMTYEQLDKKSNQLARYLKERGIQRGDFVAIEVSRQINTIVNIIGVLKANAAYVPVDPMYPEERRSYILENSAAKMYIESSIYTDKDIEQFDTSPIENQQYPEDVAYTIYTSGSTGKPKGVVITHAAVCNTILDMNDRFQISSEDRFIGISSLCFDLSVYDVFGALTSGASLVLVADQRDVQNLLAEVESKQVTIWNSVPSIMNIATETAMNIGKEIDYIWENEEIAVTQEDSIEKIYWSPVKQWRCEKNNIVIGDVTLLDVAVELFAKIYSLSQDGIEYEALLDHFTEDEFNIAEKCVIQLMKEEILIRTLLEPHEIFDGLSKMYESKYTEEILFVAEKSKGFKQDQLNRVVVHKEGHELPLEDNVELPITITQRRTERRFDEEIRITYAEFSKILTVFKQSRDDQNITYYYASAGGLYPIDVYIYVKAGRVEKVEAGLYYYNPIKNQIELIKAWPDIDDKSQYHTNKAIFNSSACSVYLIYNADVTMPKYNSLGYLYAAIDSGIMVATFTQVCEELNVGVCSIGNMKFKAIEQEFELGKNQLWLHTIEVGKRR